MTALLSLSQIKKNYGAVEALQGVDLELNKGEILALVGDNGAATAGGAHEIDPRGGGELLTQIIRSVHLHDAV